MQRPELKPTIGDAYRIDTGGCGSDWDFTAIRRRSHDQEREGDIESACNTRYEAVQRIIDLFPDNMDMGLDWDDETSRGAMMLISDSAIDHFLIGDFEMCAGMLEMLLELDPEDRLEATKRLAYSYVALEEYELFDEVINDISDKYPEKEILEMWSEFRSTGRIPDGEFKYFRKSFPVHFREFVAEDHPVDQAYVRDIEGEKPSREALAREMWLQTEHLWHMFPGFIEALREKAGS